MFPRLLPLVCCVLVAQVPLLARAQPAQPPPEEEEEEDWPEEEEGEGEAPRLRAPQVDMGGVGGGEEEEEEGAEGEGEGEGEEEEDEGEDDLPDPGDAARRLEQGAGEGTDPTVSRWTTPQTVVDLHGYLRFRGEFQDNYTMNRVLDDPATGMGSGLGLADLPCVLFRPLEDGRLPTGGCGGMTATTPCEQNANAFANMRLRLEPGIHLSDDVRVRMQLDVFDNMVLGSTPNSLVLDPYFQRYSRTAFAPNEFYTTTLEPPTYGRNSLTDSIIARRAWAEVRNRALGELRFGRMGSHWGLGILHNAGNGLDSDYQTDVDRIQLITRLAGIYLFGSFDFAAEGLVYQEFADLGGLAYDRSRIDDVTQFTVGAAYRATDEERDAALARGDAVFNIGAYFLYRGQSYTSQGTRYLTTCATCTDDTAPVFAQLGADMFVPDLWVQFLYEKLRLELEAVFVYGTIANIVNQEGDPATRRELIQFGLAFEGEYRLLNDQLGIYFNAGYATGDPDYDGLSRWNQGNNTGAVDSTFFFHPNYRIDLVFWRTIMRQIAGAYYFRPGISYDFIRNPFGQLLGARADVVWSRASETIQTWGNQPDLGVEIDASVYYRSEDGPDLLDGFYAMAQWGIFFPLGGLGYIPGERATLPSLGNAQTFRLILGVQY
ncbi:MAG: TIGR04551 family protein [Sandaracinaceae bacterium]|nr:TIGR04551 family protein [Sandaracinaceae bacterium]